ncbi:PilT/PilU family type 4a pilus ATPase [Marinibactrum halimedae]|uniref:Bacterial type II secretion system protein E domain-containing protein n=1 Tax=Marinibactrum halimedae TaxID=1444977 RepID=A0AA37WLM9_9GAMM|nr:PilT/PilU family type 4a pilus ATPase [Marinibactrum halimedae]MCD9459925.1 PilT/PilU family type 4a pilus ATPase [Marinibactrum halimedae]GLS25220.1 hypothetical protein GCM10007877_09340 [Marinibactrum halimedae]
MDKKDSGDLTGLLSVMVMRDASDLFVTANARPTIKVDGQYHPIGDDPFSAERVSELIFAVLTPEQAEQFRRDLAVDLGLEYPKVGRFRLNLYHQKGAPALVARFIKHEIPGFKALGLPPVVRKVAMAERGLILVVGGTGTGKSTTLASMIDYRNTNRAGHILTIEDPIEYTHPHKKSLISQREVGIDTHSFEDALKFALREAPDAVLVGEIRDMHTATQVLRLAETGHVCLSSLHANSASQALDRVQNLFPQSAHKRIRQDLAGMLVAIISQRMVFTHSGQRVMVPEIMMNTPYIADLIEKGETGKIKDAMSESDDDCQTFDDALIKLFEAGKISREEALRMADSKINLSVRLSADNSGYNPMQSDVIRLEKVWRSPSAKFDRYKWMSITAHERCQTIWPDLASGLAKAIKVGLQERGYQSYEPKEGVAPPPIDFFFAFSPKSKTNGAGKKPVMTTASLLMHVKDQKSGEVVWRLSATMNMQDTSLTQQELSIEISKLLASLPFSG